MIVYIINIIKERGKLQKYKSMILGSIKDEVMELEEIAIELIRANANPMAVAFLAKEIYKELKKK